MKSMWTSTFLDIKTSFLDGADDDIGSMFKQNEMESSFNSIGFIPENDRISSNSKASFNLGNI